MPLPHVQALRQVAISALVFVLAIILLLFAGATIVNYNTDQIASAFQGQSLRIFDDPEPSKLPRYSVILLLLTMPYFLGNWFMQVRASVFVPPAQVLLGRALAALHINCYAATFVTLLCLNYAELFAPTEADFRQFTLLAGLGVYFSAMFGALEHIIIGTWIARTYRPVRWLGAVTAILPAIGLLLHLSIWLNTDLASWRVLLPLMIITGDATLWALVPWYLISSPQNATIPIETDTLQL